MGDWRRLCCDGGDDAPVAELPTTLAEAHALILALAAEQAAVEAENSRIASEIATLTAANADLAAVKDAMLFGSTAQLFTGSDGVRTYFSKLPAGIKVKMGDQQAIAAGSDVLLSSGFADFMLPNGTVLPFR